ncbi:MAG: response regulator [Erysipelotrichaceae bacterium]
MYSVVVADDEIELRRAIIEMVDWAAIGFRVVGEAENGVEALELVERLEPDLLLTDIKMPFISGIELARKVREIRPAMQIAILSGYDDFAYAQQAIQYNIIKYLLKPISKEEIDHELLDIKKTMDERKKLFTTQQDFDVNQLQLEQFLMPLLLDNDSLSTYSSTNREELNQRAYELHLSNFLDDKAGYIVLVTRFLDYDKNVISAKQHRFAQDAIARKHLNCGSFYSQEKIVSLLGGMKWEIEKYINIITNEIVQTTKQVVNQDCYIGVGSYFVDLSKAHISFSEACSAIEYGQGAHRNLSFINDIERKDTLQYEFIEAVSLEIERRIKSNKEEDITTYLSDIFNKMIESKARRADIDLLIMHIISKTCTLVRSLCDDEATSDFFMKASLLSSLLSKHTVNEKRQDIMDFCILCKESISKQNRLNAQVICDELLELIQVEYGLETFSLTIASERLYISASYLSALLKKITGDSFVTLLTKKRMEVAREKVLYSNHKILEIARECGYSDQHYFSYCFKRQYGMSPNKLREQQSR